METPRGIAPGDVALVDCGSGRRLDRFGPYLLDRPAPAAERIVRADPASWRGADARFERGPGGSGRWEGWGGQAQPWSVEIEGLTLECRATDTGQVGLFLEHLPAWRWVRRYAATAGRPVRLLNLFAYTGGLTLAAAAAGAEVVHVDASRSAVAWARRNAELSALADRPVRWIVDDTEAFVARELRRGNRYDAVVLDPPSYGHAPDRSAWRLEERLPDLLRACVAVTGGAPGLLVVTAHTPGFDAETLGRVLLEAFAPDAARRGRLDAGPLELRAESGATLPAGAFARWTSRGHR